MGQEINPTAMFGGIYQHEQKSNEQAMKPEELNTVAASKEKEDKRRCHSKNQKGEQNPKPKTSLYLPADKMHALRVHCAEEEIKITAADDILMKNYNASYPPTPKEVVKEYLQILKMFLMFSGCNSKFCM